MLRANILSTTLTSGMFTAIENSLLVLGSFRFHVVHRPVTPFDSSQWTKGRSLNMTSYVFVPLRSLVNVQSKTPYPNLELQTDRFHVVHRPVTPVHSSLWTKGAELKHGVTCLRSRRTIENSLLSIVEIRRGVRGWRGGGGSSGKHFDILPPTPLLRKHPGAAPGRHPTFLYFL